MKKLLAQLILLSLLFFPNAFGQVDSLVNKYAVRDTQNLKVTLFDSEEPLEISLRFDISQYKKKKSDSEYLDALLTYHTSKTDSINKKIRVRARGEIRRTSLCDFPPLLLNFRMKDSIGGEFTGINKLKIVPYCKVGYEDFVLREYLVYKLYNLLTDYSLRVRLFKISYINTAKQSKPISQYGFAIEPISLLEKRTHTFEMKSQSVTQRSIDPEMMDRFAIFNYMIGNTDWSVPIRHNALILSRSATYNYSEPALIIPFDFDYSGLVNTIYATPFETLPIKTVRERLYTSLCRSEDTYANALKEFAAKKDDFYRVINEFPYIKERSKKDIINFLAGFFNDFDKRNSIVIKLEKDCRWFEEQSNLRVR